LKLGKILCRTLPATGFPAQKAEGRFAMPITACTFLPPTLFRLCRHVTEYRSYWTAPLRRLSYQMPYASDFVPLSTSTSWPSELLSERWSTARMLQDTAKTLFGLQRIN